MRLAVIGFALMLIFLYGGWTVREANRRVSNALLTVGGILAVILAAGFMGWFGGA